MDYYNSDIMEDPEYLAGFNKRFKAPLIDRTGIMNDDIAIISQIPEEKTDKDFNTVVDERATEILTRAQEENKDIKVSYSGGIDSTLVLIALIKQKDNFPDVDILVVLSKESVKEYPKFFGRHIRNKLPLKWAKGNNLHKVLAEKGDKDFFIVTGELGDQMFGSALMFLKNFKEDLDKDWNETFTPKFIRYWRHIVDKNPQQDFRTGNVFWWLNFVLKYQWVQLRMFAMLDGKVPYENFIHFFGGDEFQKWSMSTDMDVKFPDLKDETTYKMPAKEYIYEYTKDKEYLDNKTKKGSLKENLDAPIKENIHRITTDMELIKK